MGTLANLSLQKKLITLIGIPLVGLLFFSGAGVVDRYQVASEMEHLQDLSNLTVHISSLIHETQKERGMTAGFLGSGGKKFGRELPGQRESTNLMVEELQAFLDDFDSLKYGEAFKSVLQNATGKLDQIDGKRSDISAQRIETGQAIAYYTGMNASFLAVTEQIVLKSSQGEISNSIAAYVNFLQAKERAGVERAVMTNTFAQDKFSPALYRKFVSLVSEQDTYMRVFRSLAQKDAIDYVDGTLKGGTIDKVNSMRDVAFAGSRAASLGVDPNIWFKGITAKINLLKKVEDHLSADLFERTEQVHNAAQRTLNLFGLMALFLSAGTVVAGFIISRSVNNSIKHAVTGLGQTSENVSSAADVLSNSSSNLASGARQQASRLREISESLNDTANKTRENSSNTEKANRNSMEMLSAAESGHDAMRRMHQAIDQIKSSSDETAKIIKTIDEIAFQTNLLALNAAVEAARAGDAGRGFAVVAEEVRNLAQRSAEAAKTTNDLIENAKDNSNNGVVVSNEVSEILENIIEGIKSMTQLMGSVSEASNEQTTGIEKINKAIGELDEVTKANYSTAENSAESSGKLSTQSNHLHEMIVELASIVSGNTGGGGSSFSERQGDQSNRQTPSQDLFAGGQDSDEYSSEHSNEVISL